MRPICLSKEAKREKVSKINYKNFYFTRDLCNNLRVIPQSCSHLGLDLKCAKVQNNNFQCPYHGWKFESQLAEDSDIFDYRGIIWDYTDAETNSIEVEDLLENVNPSRWRQFKIKANYRHVLANLVDVCHFSHLHRNSPGIGLSSNYKIEQLNQNQIQCSWQTSLPRPTTSLVSLYDYCVSSRVPFFNDYLTAVNVVIPVSSFESVLLINFLFDFEEHENNPWLRFWTNRLVDLLVVEDKWVLERISVLNPQLEKETNPLILKIYASSNT